MCTIIKNGAETLHFTHEHLLAIARCDLSEHLNGSLLSQIEKQILSEYQQAIVVSAYCWDLAEATKLTPELFQKTSTNSLQWAYGHIPEAALPNVAKDILLSRGWASLPRPSSITNTAVQIIAYNADLSGMVSHPKNNDGSFSKVLVPMYSVVGWKTVKASFETHVCCDHCNIN